MNNKVKSIGLIVEDDSDFNCLRVLIKRISKRDNISFKKIIGHGCGKIKKKALAWSETLSDRGCNVLILVQDLDRNDLNVLKCELNKILKKSSITTRLVCIPIEELEAWLLSDKKGLKDTFNLKRSPNFKGKPETIKSPKEKLRNAIYTCSNKNVMYITKHNQRIAENISVEKIIKNCPSFRELNDFILELNF